MRDLLIIFDSVRYDRFVEADTPVLDSLGLPVRAWAHGTWTRPSVVSLLSGYLPQSELGQPYKPSWVMLGPEVFHDRGVPAWFLNGNAWVKNLHPRRYEDVFYPEPFSAERMVGDAVEIMEAHREFFIAILFVETHGPYGFRPGEDQSGVVELFKAYNRGEPNTAPSTAAFRSRRSIEHLDGLVEPLLDLPDRVIFTSDHGELQGENHRVGHDPSFPFDPCLLRVPLVIG